MLFGRSVLILDAACTANKWMDCQCVLRVLCSAFSNGRMSIWGTLGLQCCNPKNLCANRDEVSQKYVCLYICTGYRTCMVAQGCIYMLAATPA